MTYYLTESSSPEMIAEGYREGIASAVKLYPANATTNSAQGVTDVTKVYSTFEAMQAVGMPLLLHGETVMRNGKEIPNEDREKVFLDSTLPTLLKNFPSLKVVLEHATTNDAVDFVKNENSARLASTITVHHLMENSVMVDHDTHPNYLKCMPVIKSEHDQKALRIAATSGDSHFFLGTDSAPHPVSAKERDNPAAGVFTAPAALELYAQVFEEEGKLENLEAFTSLNGSNFYGLSPNEEKITLIKEPWTIDSLVQVSNGDMLRPFGFDENRENRIRINWKLT
jgi:dihydroorotase